MKNKITYVLWSGGLDSTFLIQHILQKNSTNEVYAGYVEVINNKEKTKMELDAISKMSPIFKEIYGSRFCNLGKVMSLDVLYPTNRTGLSQVPLWISALMSTTPKDVNEIAIGYVLNDCAVSYITEIKRLWNSYLVMSSYGFKRASLTFPLIKWTKLDIFNTLHSKLRDHVVCCEQPTEKDGKFISCNICDPCKRSVGYQLNNVIQDLEPIKKYTEERVSLSCESCDVVENTPEMEFVI